MAKFARRYNHKRIGLSPGSTDHLSISVNGTSILGYKYGDKEFEKKALKDTTELKDFVKTGKETFWINVNGLNTQIVEQIGAVYNIHPLFLEDILHTGQRPKIDEGENYLYLVLHMLNYETKTAEVTSEQVSFIFNQDYLISFKEREGDLFDPVRNRLEMNKGKIRKSGGDYLAYALLDVIVDRFYVILEQLGNKIEMLESKVIEDPSIEVLHEINRLKREFIVLRKNIWPLRDIINALLRPDIKIINPTTKFFIKDVYDHTIQIMDSIDTYREMISNILDIYMSSVSNKQNDVMKTLTIIATIFIPLTFLVGVYGMNFHEMPELEWKYGYYTIWGIMIIVASFLLIYFKRKDWM